MDTITGSEAAGQLVAIAGAVVILCNAITMTLSNRKRYGLAKWFLFFLNALAGNIAKNKNDPSL